MCIYFIATMAIGVWVATCFLAKTETKSVTLRNGS